MKGLNRFSIADTVEGTVGPRSRRSISVSAPFATAQYEKAMLPPRKDLDALEADIVKQMEAGMRKANSSTIMMLPTYVLRLPTGEETGSCYAIDIGGTNFRVMHCKLSKEKGKVESSVIEQVAIPRDVYTGTADALFGFLARCMHDFVAKTRTAEDAAEPVVGFCFSFPMEQAALDRATLSFWTKGFEVAGVEGQDVVKLLSDALVKAGCPCRVSAIINDSVGVLTAARYEDPATEIGIILGTGTNACIVDKVSKMSKWRPAGASPETVTAINTEWGCYSSDLLPRVQEDKDLDEVSGAIKGKMLIEKMMSGLWMGDNARRILLTFARRTQLFGAKVPPALEDPAAFTTAHLSMIESDCSPLRSTVARVLKEALGVNPADLCCETLYIVQSVCRLVVRRSARMAAVATLAILRLQGWLDAPRRLVVAVDGGVFLKYYNWRLFLDQYLREGLTHAGKDAKKLAALLEFRPQADGSCIGAAVLAAAAVAGDQ
ncbi:MAG: hexokinase [Monoraphidium minutum]|nr:MAG: hexokinase [Monoraphidium minutum]